MAISLDPKTDLAQQILIRQRELERYRDPYDTGIWQEIADNFNILRDDMYSNNVYGSNTHRGDYRGEKHGRKLYDGTPVSALNIFTDGFYGAMISRAITWFVMKLPRKFGFLENIPEVRLWMQEATGAIYSEFNNSNFYSEMRPFIRDGASIGTASLACEEDIANNKLAFHAMHPREGFVAENHLGVVDTYFRRYKMTARQAQQKFKGSESLMSQTLKDAIKDGRNTEFEFLHAIFPRTDFDDRKIDVTNKKFASVHMEYSRHRQDINQSDKKNVLKESGFDLFPMTVWRYFKSAEGPYGDSPCGFALVDAENLQSMAKSITRAGEISADPAFNVPSEMQGRVRTGPHGMNYVGQDINRRISPVTSGINYPIALDREDKKREMIARHLNVDTFLLLQQAPRQMTAEEVREKITEKATLLSPMIGNFTSALDNIIDLVFTKGLQAGRIPQPPDIILEVMAGERIDTDFLGILAQAQKRMFEKRAISEGLESIAPLAEIYGDIVLDLVNPERTAMELLKADNFPQVGMNTPEEMRLLRETRAEQQQEANQKIDQERTASVMKDLSQAKKNSGGNLTALTEELVS